MTVTTTDVAEWLRGDVQIVDVRSPDAYNGWRLAGEVRGGHIPGARSLPAKWGSYIDWLDIVHAKGITPDRPVLLYGYDGEVEPVAALFRRAGFPDVRTYDNFIAGWSADPTLPLVHMPRYETLVPPKWLHDRDVILCHCHYRNPGDYDKGHIPGAIALDSLALESPETWNRRTPEELRTALEAHGIRHDSTVVVYGRYSSPRPEDAFPGSSAGHLGAMRCAFLMLYAGVKDVRILNGGLRSWTDAGYPVTTEPTPPMPVDDFGAEVPGRPDLVLDTPEVKELLAAPSGSLVSMRSRPEVEGKVSGYNYFEAAGRIPGEVWGDNGRDAYHMDHYRNPDHTTREFPEVEARLAQLGVARDEVAAFFCGTGWRASEAFWNAWLLGWPQPKVYDGGWFEWSADPDNPIETGLLP